MKESGEVHSEDDKALPETNKKRTVKTRAQVEALEKFYDEHKYPTESMKSELAESIGLTEKQVSGWFCHRRLKDKRSQNGEALGNGRQDRSSGIVQDRGSGFKQDSCGSTKQWEDRNFDLREVESRRLNYQEYSTADFIYERGGNYSGNPGRPDDTPSGSSSSQRNMTFPSDEDPFDIASSRYQTLSVPTDIKVVRARTGPSGYLKVKGQAEIAAITAVKRQLGRHYREDGPPLGVEFDPLPPGSFESPNHGADTESFYPEEPVVMRSPDVSIAHKKSHPLTGYGCNSKTSSHNFDMNGARLRTARVSVHPENHMHQKFKQKLPTFNYTESYTGKKSSIGMYEGSLRGITAFDGQDSHHGLKHGVGGMSLDAVSSHHNLSPYNVRVDREQPEKWLNNNTEWCPKTGRKAGFGHKSSNLSSKGSEYDGFQDKGQSRRKKKEAKTYGEDIAPNDDFNSLQLNGPPKSEMRVKKRFRNELPQGCHRKASMIEEPPWANPADQVPRSAAEIPSSFSEDDETDSSME